MKCKNIVIEDMCRMLENPTTPQVQNELYITENNKIIGTCAFGEIGLQLHLTDLDMDNIIEELVEIGIPEQLVDECDCSNLRNSIIEWNDRHNLSKPEIAQKIRAKFGDVE